MDLQGERQTAAVDDKLPQANWLSGIDVTGETMTGAQDTADKAGWHWTKLYGGGQVYFRGNTADKPAGIALQWYKEDGSPASVAETQVPGTLDMLNNWNYGRVMAAVPADAATARVRITAEVGTVSVSGMGLFSTADYAAAFRVPPCCRPCPAPAGLRPPPCGTQTALQAACFFDVGELPDGKCVGMG